MKNSLYLLMFFLLGNIAFALNTGDIAFIGWNAENNDDIAFVTFSDIPPNTTLYFCDSEWDGSAFGTDENDATWVTPSNVIPAGTIITIYEYDGANINANYGTITGGGGLSKSSDALFLFEGTNPRTPTKFLGAIANHPGAFGTLDGTGLQSGFTAIVLPNSADIAEYNGPRSGIDKNGYFSYLNDHSNWLVQIDVDDCDNDGIAPDLPYNTSAFTFSMNDVTAPYVTGMKVVSNTELKLYFSEDVVNATDAMNYTLNPTVTVNSITYNTEMHCVTIDHSPLTEGIAYTLSVNDLKDASNNIMMMDYVSDNFYYNAGNPNLVITEIMYNPPSDNSDNLEFVEIYNNGDNTANLGGIRFKDEGDIDFTFPEMILNSGDFVLLATDKASADAFYGQTFHDMVQGVDNMLSNGGEMLQILNTNGDVIFEMEYDDKSPWNTIADGDGPSLELINPNVDPNSPDNWNIASNFIGQSLGEDVFASPGSINIINVPSVSFIEDYVSVDENGSSAQVTLKISAAHDKDVKATVYVLSGIGTAANGVCFTYNETEYTFPANSTADINVDVTINDDMLENGDRFFALGIKALSNAVQGGNNKVPVYILDDEETYPIASNALDIEFINSYLVDANGSAEILAYDASTQRIYVLNSTATKVEVLDFSDPMNITKNSSIDMSQYGNGATSIAVRNGVVAATVEGGNQMRGEVVFLDLDGNIINDVEVGYLPDMITFTPDGMKVLVANEGEPNEAYTVDPEGSVSIIDISEGIANLTQDDVTEVNFHAFDPMIDQLRAEGVRIFGFNATVSRDLEPEYITISEDSQTAWVACQENNALVVVDIPTGTATDIIPLGTKDHSIMRNAFDQTDKTDFIYFGTWNVKGMYHPDAIASYQVGETNYLVTANEGDQREYNHINEDTSVEDLNLDPTAYPHADLLQKDEVLGRLAASPYDGDTDGDGDIDEIHSFGARSFSIWNASTGELVYDSGSDFEKITANDPVWGALFNASNSNNKFKNRSDNKGPEPEGVVVEKIDGRYYAIIGLERIGGIMTYDITDPMNPMFVDYSNSRDLGNDEGGDLAPEGIIYIRPEDSPVANGLIVIANEESATISVYSINNVFATMQVNVSNKQVCFNGSVELGEFDGEMNDITVTGGSGDFTYSWSPAYRLDDATISNPTYGPVYLSNTAFTLTVTDNVTAESITKNVSVNTLPQPNITATFFKLLSKNDPNINCYDVTGWVQGNVSQFNWYDSGLYPIGAECVDFTSVGIHRIFVEGVNEAGCTSNMKRVIVFTANSKDNISESDVAVSEDGVGFLYANPSPVVSDFNLFADFENASFLDVAIYDISGRKMMNFTKNGVKQLNQTINIERFDTGVYFVTVSNGETSVTKKIVKQ